MYLTYDEYQNMGGTLDEVEFTSLESLAETRINHITFNRLKDNTEYPSEVKLCVFEIIKLIMAKQSSLLSSVDGKEPAIVSQSNDGVSIGYNILSASAVIQASESEIARLIKGYLSDVRNRAGLRLTYRGLYPNE